MIMNRMHAGEWEWVGSEVLVIELENTPDVDKRKYLTELASGIKTNITLSESEIIRANELEKLGFKSFDATHIACSESVRADVFLTTDDRLLKKAAREKDNINVQVANPLSWLMEMIP
jgi:predicted nucleic acid-binding protein